MNRRAYEAGWADAVDKLKDLMAESEVGIEEVHSMLRKAWAEGDSEDWKAVLQNSMDLLNTELKVLRLIVEKMSATRAPSCKTPGCFCEVTDGEVQGRQGECCGGQEAEAGLRADVAERNGHHRDVPADGTRGGLGGI